MLKYNDMKKKRVRKKKLKKEYKIALIIVVVAFVLSIAISTLVHTKMNTYNGLDDAGRLEENQYNLELLKNAGTSMAYYEDENYYSVMGIDVSTYQETIDWKQVADAGVQFAMIRLGYSSYVNGTISLDERYKENIKGAKKAGINTGVYFFSQATTTDEAIKEAKFVIKHIRFKGVKLPIAFDMEPVKPGDRISKLSKEEKTEIADAFCKCIRANGYEPIVYGNPSWLRDEIELEYLTGYDTWLANYTETTGYPYKYRMWQFTDRGQVPGINGYVDLNLYFVEK